MNDPLAILAQFGYPQAPQYDPRQMGISARDIALAEAQDPILRQQLARADALRGQVANNQNPYDLFGGLMKTSAAHRQTQQAEGQQQANVQRLAAAQQAQAEMAAKQANYEPQLKLAQERRARAQFLEEQAFKERMKRLELANRQQEKPNFPEPKTHYRINEDGSTTPFNGAYNSETGSYIDYDSRTQVDQAKVMKHGDRELSEQERNSLSKAPGNFRRILEFTAKPVQDYEALAQPLEIPSEVLNRWLLSPEQQGLVEWLEKNDHGSIASFIPGYSGKEARRKAQTKEVQDAIATMNDIRLNFIMPYREMVTTGVLSDQDVREFDRNINIRFGMSGASLQKAMDNLTSSMFQQMKAQYEIYKKTGSSHTYGAARALFGPILDAPEGEDAFAKAKKARAEAEANRFKVPGDFAGPVGATLPTPGDLTQGVQSTAPPPGPVKPPEISEADKLAAQRVLANPSRYKDRPDIIRQAEEIMARESRR